MTKKLRLSSWWGWWYFSVWPFAFEDYSSPDADDLRQEVVHLRGTRLPGCQPCHKFHDHRRTILDDWHGNKFHQEVDHRNHLQDDSLRNRCCRKLRCHCNYFHRIRNPAFLLDDSHHLLVDRIRCPHNKTVSSNTWCKKKWINKKFFPLISLFQFPKFADHSRFFFSSKSKFR